MLKINIFSIIFCLVVSFEASAADLTATVDNSQIAYGETFELRLSYAGTDGNSLQPDFSVLQKDFNIYSTSSSLNSQIINGNVSQKREWILTLLPKQEGKMQIPAIKAGKYSSLPVNIEVLSSDAVISGAKNENSGKKIEQSAVFVADFAVENKNPYVEQEISAVLTIRDNRNLQFNAEPYFENDDNWVIKRIDKPTIEQKNGENITKINYVLFPQKSGKIELPRAVIDGYYVAYDNTPRRVMGGGFLQMFDMDMGTMLGMRKPVLFKSKSEEINVKPVPSQYSGNEWVPAQVLVAKAEWIDKTPKFKVGETVSREISIAAVGVTENRLPEIDLATNSEWKIYPDKPQYTSAVHENKLISQKVVRIVYIPQKSGKLLLPEISIPWFNVKTQKEETAVIESEELEIEPNSAYEVIEREENKQKSTLGENHQSPKDENHKNDLKMPGNYGIITAILAAFLSGILISFLLFGGRRSKTKEMTEATVWKDIRRAFAQKNYRDVRDALIIWGQKTFSDKRINNLKDLQEEIGDESFDRQCEIINARLYGNSSENPDEKTVIEVLKKVHKNRVKNIETPLPNLYK